MIIWAESNQVTSGFGIVSTYFLARCPRALKNLTLLKDSASTIAHSMSPQATWGPQACLCSLLQQTTQMVTEWTVGSLAPSLALTSGFILGLG